MIVEHATIINGTGLHARPASEFVMLAKTFECNITIRDVNSNAPAVNAKSIVRILSQGMGQGTEIELVLDGADEEKAAKQLVALINSGFGE